MTLLSVTAKLLHDFVIEVFQPNAPHACAVVTGALGSGETKLIPCQSGVIGRIVKIRMTGIESRVLALCEVQVFGMPSESTNLCYLRQNNSSVLGFQWYFCYATFPLDTNIRRMI